MKNRRRKLPYPHEELIRVRAEDLKAYKPTKAEIERFKNSPIDFSDIPPLTDEELARMMPISEFRKLQPVAVRVDRRIIEWLKSKGPDHLTRLNDMLLKLMEADQGK
jgi:uncharacterized protein (DUF4415 family)